MSDAPSAACRPVQKKLTYLCSGVMVGRNGSKAESMRCETFIISARDSSNHGITIHRKV